ncbi:MAG TPA: IS4 family transposase [Dehalococcoidia bacterium]|nr:IS4 family transposase [Dehalococcoidia bacterium]
MRRSDVIAWVLSVSIALRLSQAKTLSALVAAALGTARVSLAELGRHLTGPAAAKHRIKRTWRFTANERVEVATAMRGVVRHLLKRRRRPLVVGFDWTEVGGFCTLMAAAVMKGRAVPLLWVSASKGSLAHRRNALEEKLLGQLREMLPEGMSVIVLADRGFGRTELARICQELDLHYIIRIKPDVWVETGSFRGKLRDYPVHKGMCRVLRDVVYRRRDPVRQHVVIRWVEGLPKKRDEPWFLMTDLGRDPRSLSRLYGKRMTVEELFRDDKNRRNGWGLRDVQMTQAGRFDRLLLILALAYLLLVGLGLRARRRYRAGMWCSSNDADQCSVFTIGRAMLNRMRQRCETVFDAVAEATVRSAPNWG